MSYPLDPVSYPDNFCFQDPRIALDHDDPEPMDFYPVCGGASRDLKRIRAFFITEDRTEVNCPFCLGERSSLLPM